MKNFKKSKKLFTMVVIICIISILTAQVYAVPIKYDTTYTYEGMTEEKAVHLHGLIFGQEQEPVMQTLNIFCIFGHSKETGIIKSYIHNFYLTNPKCQSIDTIIEYCTRNNCSYYVVKNEIIKRIVCH